MKRLLLAAKLNTIESRSKSKSKSKFKDKLNAF